ncbi:hypothetical protein HUJ05_002306 [Dendroctonus ponderosae]|nr:hypothetical protein HUJ05_002306 [Dendroctonus ponderosae]
MWVEQGKVLNACSEKRRGIFGNEPVESLAKETYLLNTSDIVQAPFTNVFEQFAKDSYSQTQNKILAQSSSTEKLMMVENTETMPCDIDRDVQAGKIRYKSEQHTKVPSVEHITRQTRYCAIENSDKMYTNPFSRTHSSIRQVIDKFLHINQDQKSQGIQRNTSSNSVSSSSSSCSGKHKNLKTSARLLFQAAFKDEFEENDLLPRRFPVGQLAFITRDCGPWEFLPDVPSTTAVDIFKGDEAVGEVISRAFRLRLVQLLLEHIYFQLSLQTSYCYLFYGSLVLTSLECLTLYVRHVGFNYWIPCRIYAARPCELMREEWAALQRF